MDAGVVQGLHRFYQRRTNDVIASWMTRQDRQLAIADNLAYVDSVIDAASREMDASRHGWCWLPSHRESRWVFVPRPATTRRVDGVIAVGGDVPPEIDGASLARTHQALVCRGASDEWYTTRNSSTTSPACASPA
jgi:hypothetical protein